MEHDDSSPARVAVHVRLAHADEVEVIQLRVPHGGAGDPHLAAAGRARRRDLRDAEHGRDPREPREHRPAQAGARYARPTPRRLLISVRQDPAAASSARGRRLRHGRERRRARRRERAAASRLRGDDQRYDSSGTRDGSTATQVQALEGSPAFIPSASRCRCRAPSSPRPRGRPDRPAHDRLPEHGQRRLRYAARVRRSRVPRHRPAALEPRAGRARRGELPADSDHRERTARRMVSARRHRPVVDAGRSRGSSTAIRGRAPRRSSVWVKVDEIK